MTTQTLDDLMEFGQVVYSDGNGNVTGKFNADIRGPEGFHAEVDEDGQLTGEPIDMEGFQRQGWSLLTGFTAQMGHFMTEIMHPSERIGGKLESHIRENAGYYVAVTIDSSTENEDGETDPIGWAVAFKEAE